MPDKIIHDTLLAQQGGEGVRLVSNQMFEVSCQDSYREYIWIVLHDLRKKKPHT